MIRFEFKSGELGNFGSVLSIRFLDISVILAQIKAYKPFFRFSGFMHL